MGRDSQDNDDIGEDNRQIKFNLDQMLKEIEDEESSESRLTSQDEILKLMRKNKKQS